MKHDFEFMSANKYRAISGELQQARLALLEYAIARQTPFTVERAKEELAKTAGDKSGGLVDSLLELNLISANIEGEIAYLYPVSCEETVHRVRLADGREFWAMCAIDALGCASTFGVDAEIFSVTKDTQEDVYVMVAKDGIKSVSPAGMLVSYYDNWVVDCVNY